MSQSYDLFCRWKHVQKIQSDNAGALALGVTRATVSSWKQGKNAEIHFIERMAEDIGDNPEAWSALVMAERSNSPDESEAWKRIARRLGATVAMLALFVAPSLIQQAHAATLNNLPSSDPSTAAAAATAAAAIGLGIMRNEPWHVRAWKRLAQFMRNSPSTIREAYVWA